MGHLKKKAGAATVIAAISAGTAVGIYAYQNNTDFTPSGEAQKLHANKVDFSGNDDIKSQKSQEDSSDDKKSALLDQNALEGTDAAYLFSQAQLELPLDADLGEEQSVILNNMQSDDRRDDNKNIDNKITDNSENIVNASSENVYNVTGNKSNADIIIEKKDRQEGMSVHGITTGDGDSKNDNGTGSSDNTDSGSKNDSESDDKNNTDVGIDDNNNNNNNSNSNSNNNDDKKSDSDGGTTGVYPSDKVTNPTPKKNEPNYLPEDPKKFNENDKELINSESTTMCIESNSIEFGGDSYYIYKDQTITATDLMCALDTYIVTQTGDSSKYYTLGLEDLDKYIRFTGVSFDGGKTWNSSFPVSIPKNASINDMRIQAEYRFSQTDEWQRYTDEISCPLKSSILYVLSKTLTDSDEQINTDNVLNASRYDVSSINLYYYQESYLGSNGTRLTQLFPGWTERGQLVDWNYEVTEGRHVLEPAEMVDLSEQFEAKLQLYWLKNQQTGLDDLVYLQTLTGINGQGVKLLSAWNGLDDYAGDFVKVPDYIQAVDIATKTEVGTLSIPESVIQINNNDGLRVNDGYVVSKENDNFSSQDGILCDKGGTEMIDIPYNVSELDISSGIKKVNIADDNNIKRITFEAESFEDYPSIEIQNLHDCAIVVSDELMDLFVKDNVKLLNNSGNTVVSEEIGESIFVENGVAINTDGEIKKAISLSGTTFQISSNITAIKADAFASAENLSTLVLSDESSKDLKLEAGCFEGSSIEQIICSNKAQFENIKNQLDSSGKPDIQLIMTGTMSGYTYYEKGDGTIELVKAPADITEFDGVIKSDTVGESDLSVTCIGDQAFADCEQLKWVTLPEEVTDIGYRAFYGCDSLEGVLIQTKDHITIGNEAFGDCKALRFVASNAKSATMVDKYDPDMSVFYESDWIFSNSFFFVPDDSEGYGDNVSTMWGYDIDEYIVEELGENGKVLYGANSSNEKIIALRSGKEMPDKVLLPAETEYIYEFAFAETVSGSGAYEINWQDMDSLCWLGSYSFMDSQLSGDIVIGNNDKYTELDISEGTFRNCDKITSIEIKNALNYIGGYAFTGCKALESVHICSIVENNIYLNSGIFDGCDSMRDFILDVSIPPEMSLYSPGIMYRFNYDWTEEEEAEKLHITVPEGTEEAYIKAWRYIRLGYTGWFSSSEYLEMWNDVSVSLMQFDDDTGELIYPEAEEVDAEVKKQILDSENYIRNMLGAENVTEPTDFYPYRLDDTMLTLIGVPSDAKKISLDAVSVGLPEGWYLDYIGTGAFEGASNLSKIIIPDNLSGIEMNAFAGASADVSKLTVTFTGETPPALIGASQEVPFLFGQTDDRLCIEVPEGCEEAYIDAWKYPMAGYEDEADLIWAVMDEIRAEIADDEEVDLDNIDIDELINTRINEIIQPVEKRLRSMMGLEPVEIKDIEGDTE